MERAVGDSWDEVNPARKEEPDTLSVCEAKHEANKAEEHEPFVF